MNFLDKYFLSVRVMATALLLLSGFLECVYHPGPLDTLNGVAQGLAIYAIWRASSRKMSQDNSIGSVRDSFDENV